MEDTNAPTAVAEPSLLALARHRLRRQWGRLFPKPSQLEIFAERELRAAGLFDTDGDYGGMLGDAVLKLIRQMAHEGHSGFSAGMTVSIFEKLARYEPLTPLTGEDDEWMDVSDMSGEPFWQNKRCSAVFKRADGTAQYLNAIVFEEPNGRRYTSGESCRDVTFPYAPATEIVKVPAPEESSKDEDWARSLPERHGPNDWMA